MKLVVVTQWVRTVGASPTGPTPRPPVRSAPAGLPARGRTEPGGARRQAASWSPDRGLVVARRRSLKEVVRGTADGWPAREGRRSPWGRLPNEGSDASRYSA